MPENCDEFLTLEVWPLADLILQDDDAYAILMMKKLGILQYVLPFERKEFPAKIATEAERCGATLVSVDHDRDNSWTVEERVVRVTRPNQALGESRSAREAGTRQAQERPSAHIGASLHRSTEVPVVPQGSPPRQGHADSQCRGLPQIRSLL